MNKKSTIENLYKKELNNEKFEFNENLWGKLDEQLGPVRAAYHKKEKRRAIILWASVLLLVGTGAGIGLSTYKNQNSSNPNTQSTTASTSAASKSQIVATDGLTTNTATQNVTNTTTKIAGADDTNTGTSNFNTPTQNSSTVNQNTTAANTNTASPLVNNLESKRKATKSSNKKAKDLSSTDSRDQKVYLNQHNEEETTTYKEEMVAEKEATSSSIEKDISSSSATPPVTPTEIAKQDKVLEKIAKKKVGTKNTTSFFAAAGVNVATPIKEPGYFAGIMMQKQIDDKRIFIGLKLAHNELNHQLISSNKANVFPQITDAVIDKMTVIQMPFGYQFQLNKKAGERAASLNVGFEPTLLTGVKTIYYDDLGIAGGPRTAVVNSPLLKNAINKFNVSFIAGVQLPLTNSLWFTLNGGYGLIDITDKQYYNRTIKNNNLKYLQAGVLLRLK